MKRIYWLSGVFLFVFTFVLGSAAFGAACPSLVGTWNVVSDSASYDAGGFDYVTAKGTLTIVNQSGCLFYGTYQRTGTGVTEPLQNLTGAFGSASEIRLTGIGLVGTGRLVGPRRIEALISDTDISDGAVNTARAIATKD